MNAWQCKLYSSQMSYSGQPNKSKSKYLNKQNARDAKTFLNSSLLTDVVTYDSFYINVKRHINAKILVTMI